MNYLRVASLFVPEETLCRVKQPASGVVIYIDPINADIGPFEAIPVDVYVFADTWGIYVDELEINITGLPRYTLGICIQVAESPISLSISAGASSRIPILKCVMKLIAVDAALQKDYTSNIKTKPIHLKKIVIVTSFAPCTGTE